MSNPVRQLSQSYDMSARVAQIVQTRTRLALEHLSERLHQAYERQVVELTARPIPLWGLWASGAQYAVDFAQRSVLLWDTLRQRGNNFIDGHFYKGQRLRAWVPLHNG